MDFEEARQIALAELRRRHNGEEPLDVVDRFVTAGGQRISPDYWMIELLVHPKVPLREGFQWEVISGRSVLVHVNEKTGTRQVVFHRSAAEPVTIFRASIH